MDKGQHAAHRNRPPSDLRRRLPMTSKLDEPEPIALESCFETALRLYMYITRREQRSHASFEQARHRDSVVGRSIGTGRGMDG